MDTIDVIPSFLGTERRNSILQVLDSPTLSWAPSEALAKTGRGNVFQLATDADRQTPQMMNIKSIFAAIVYAKLAQRWHLLDPNSLRVQVFPVKMTAGEDTFQLPHVDHSGNDIPLVTAIYYAHLEDVVGGELLVYPEGARGESGDYPRHVHPVLDTLVAIRGNRVHAVAPLLGGSRTSLVCNFYSQSDGA